MKPPWAAHPELPFGSIGWRMGYGEDYWMQFHRWYGALRPDRRDQYERDHPEPEPWAGFYTRTRASLDPPR
jgi:hypothetical protein